jgi:hypothetical protein
MKKNHSKQRIFLTGKITAVTTLFLTGTFFLLSFTVKNITADFLKELGISKANADAKIISSIMGGSLDQYGVRNAKNIAVGNRAAVIKELLTYTKTYVNSAAFIRVYNETREREKPEVRVMQTPEAMQKELIAQNKQSVTDIEASVAKADASMKPVFEKMLLDAKKQLKQAEDPNNSMIAHYRKSYPQGLKDMETVNRKLLADWEAKYPANHLLFIKMRLQQFFDETSDIDFSAQLIEKNGKKYFVNKAYESKGNRWKMAYRAGKDAVETVRSAIKQWMVEIK